MRMREIYEKLEQYKGSRQHLENEHTYYKSRIDVFTYNIKLFLDNHVWKVSNIMLHLVWSYTFVKRHNPNLNLGWVFNGSFPQVLSNWIECLLAREN